MNEMLLNYGVLGVVVIALATFIKTLMKKHDAEREDREKTHRNEREEMLKAHRDERKEWRQDVEQSNGELKKSFDANTIVMREIRTLIQSKE